MSESRRDLLRRRLLLDYDKLKKRLANRLGSLDRASDALQDAWIGLEGATQLGAIHQPERYLYRIAYHLALKQLHKEPARLSLEEARAALNLADEAPGPERIVEAKSETIAVAQALAELSPRRRAILLASRIDGIPLKDIALSHKISQRMVEMELKLALVHCGRRLGKKVIQRFGPRSPEGSS